MSSITLYPRQGGSSSNKLVIKNSLITREAFLKRCVCTSYSTEQKTDPTAKRKEGRINNTLHLWEFLLELLEDERYTPLISWTRKEEGEFKIKRQEDVARKWGRLKQRASMNYDKLSRSLRYYYHKGIIKKVSHSSKALLDFLIHRGHILRALIPSKVY